MSLRVTKQTNEVLVAGDGALRVTKQTNEVLVGGDGELRVSKQFVEVLTSVVSGTFASANNVLAFTQNTVGSVTSPAIIESVNSAITFTDNAATSVDFTASLSDVISFVSATIGQGPISENLLSFISFGQAATGIFGPPWGGVFLEDTITFVSKLNKESEGSANNTLSFSQEAYRHQTPSSPLSLVQTIDSGKSKSVDDSELGLTQTVELSNDFLRVLEDTNFIGHSLTYYVESPCGTKQYAPFVGESTIPGSPAPPETEEPVIQADPTVSRFKLTYPALATPTDTITLKAPELDNIDRLSYTRINRETRGGKLTVFADPIWPTTQTVIVTFVGLEKTEVDDLQAFFVSYIGEEVGMQDWEGREWVGVVTTPNEAAVQDGKRGWTITFEFEGVLIDGYAPNDAITFSQTVTPVLVSP
jgi:hypothetical protein